MSINDKISMFYNAKPIIFERAKAMCENMTQAENAVWELLKTKNMLGLRFKPQHPIDIFITDFYCHPLKLVIEIDGGIHKSVDQREYDIGREAELEHWGIKSFGLQMKKLKITSLIYNMKSNEFAWNDEQNFKVPSRGFRGETCWQSWKAATRNPVEVLRYE